MSKNTLKNRVDAWERAGGKLTMFARYKKRHPKLYPYMKAIGSEGVQLMPLLYLLGMVLLVLGWFNALQNSLDMVSRPSAFSGSLPTPDYSSVVPDATGTLPSRVSQPHVDEILPSPSVTPSPSLSTCGGFVIPIARAYRVVFDEPERSALNLRRSDGVVLDLLYHNDRLLALDVPYSCINDIPYLHVRSLRLRLDGLAAYGRDGDIYLEVLND